MLADAMAGLRYLLYLGFALVALIFWPTYFMLGLGIFPLPAEPVCSIEPTGCAPPTLFEHVLAIVSIFGALPATMFLFVFYRRWVRRLLKLDADLN